MPAISRFREDGATSLGKIGGVLPENGHVESQRLVLNTWKMLTDFATLLMMGLFSAPGVVVPPTPNPFLSLGVAVCSRLD